MRTYLDCYPCFLRQALEAARQTGASYREQKEILERVLEALRDLDVTSSPPEIGDRVHRIVRETMGQDDPYLSIKEEQTSAAMALYPRMKELLEQADDALDVAVRLAIAGNVIDAAPGHRYDLWASVERVLAQPFATNNGGSFRRAVAEAERILYLADNAGEAVFDRVLIETLEAPVMYAVKSAPVLNDATQEDAEAAGIDKAAVIVRTGSDAPGTILSRCSSTFHQLYESADVVIAKGQANYETLSQMGPQVHFLLQVKCPVIARDVGVPVGSIVMKQGT